MPNVLEKIMRHDGFLFPCLLCRKIKVLFRGVNLIILQARVDEHLLGVVKIFIFSFALSVANYIYRSPKMVKSISMSRGSLKIGRD